MKRMRMRVSLDFAALTGQPTNRMARIRVILLKCSIRINQSDEWL
jgi:hypothetical protein